MQSNDINCNRRFVEAGIGIGLAREYPGIKRSTAIELLDVSDFKGKQEICSYYKNILRTEMWSIL